MKSLKGMKNNFSSFENKKLSSLESIKGGLAEAGTVISSTPTQAPEGCSDCTNLTDSGKTITITIC